MNIIPFNLQNRRLYLAVNGSKQLLMYIIEIQLFSQELSSSAKILFRLFLTVFQVNKPTGGIKVKSNRLPFLGSSTEESSSFRAFERSKTLFFGARKM